MPDEVEHFGEIEHLLRDAEAALREAEALLEHANLAWDGWKVADRIADHFGSIAPAEKDT